VTTAWPVAGDGIQIRARLDRAVIGDANESLGLLDISFGENMWTFFDQAWLKNRGFYQRDREYDFAVAALAYRMQRCSPAFEEQFLKAIVTHYGPRAYLDPGPFLPLAGGADDDASILGVIKSIRPIQRILGRPAWDVVIHRGGVAARVLVTDRAWKGEVPGPGEWVYGPGWIQGSLCSLARDNKSPD